MPLQSRLPCQILGHGLALTLCTLIDDYIFFSYRAGRDCRPPDGASRIPIGLFVACRPGSRGLSLTYSLTILNTEAAFANGDKVTQGKIFAPAADYCRPADPNHGLRTIEQERLAAHALMFVLYPSGIVRAGDVKVPIQLEAWYKPLATPYETLTQVDRNLFTGERAHQFELVFPATGGRT